jgi:ATP-binding cassette, subfamily B, bacterial PglK
MNFIIKTLSIFRLEDKIKISFLFFLILLNVFLEMMGISLIFPVLGFIISENFFTEYSIYFKFLDIFFELNRQNLVIFFSICLMSVFLIKNLIALYFVYYKYKFTYDLLNYFTENLYLKYIRKNISFFSNTNSSIPVRNIDNVGIFTEAINQFLYILIEIIFFISVLILLFYINVINTLYLLVVIFIALTIFRKLTKKKLIDIGNKRQFFLQKKIQSLLETINAIKEIKIFFKEKFFFNRFKRFLIKYSKTSRRFETLQSSPRLLLEVLGVFCLSSILIINILLNYDSEIIITSIAIFGVSAIKILPGLSRILTSIQFLNHYMPVINTTLDELKANTNFKPQVKSIQKKKNFEFQKSLNIQNLFFSYEKQEILKNVNLLINKNEVVGIVGKSGCGKSTLANLITGILKPVNGSIKIDDKFNVAEALELNQNIFGYIPQQTFLLDDNIKNNVTFGEYGKDFDKTWFWKCLEISKIDSFVKNLKEKENTMVGEKGVKISGGQAQRLGIARALYRKPSIILLDEATSSLDIETEKDFISSINQVKEQYTIIIITHRVASLDICDRIFKIENGDLKQV